MFLRRVVGSLLTRRFSPRATPRTAPARSLHHSVKDLPISDVAGAVAVGAVGIGTLLLQYLRKDPAADGQVAPKEEEDLKARFEDWMKEFNKTYRDEEEKAMRFQVFKDKIKWIESQPAHERFMFLPPNCLADMKDEEICTGLSMVEIDLDTIRHNKKLNEWLARNDEGERFFWPPKLQAEMDKEESLKRRPCLKQGDKRATKVSA